MSFPHYKQLDAKDCGPTCLRMITKFYGKQYSMKTLRERSHITNEGVSMHSLSLAAESIGFRTTGVKINFEQLVNEVVLPSIIYWHQRHFVVVYKISRRKSKEIIYLADPAVGLIHYEAKEFIKAWASTTENDEKVGFALLLEPMRSFFASTDEKPDKENFFFLFKYLSPYRKLIVQLLLGLFVGTLLQLILPFLTQLIVDKGIGNHNIKFVYLVLVAQVVLTISRVSIEFIRGWILLHIGTRINVSLISDFLTKLMKLPINFFESKRIGDLMQRIVDNKRIETFLTATTLSVLFSIINLVTFGAIMLYYNAVIFIIFSVGSVLYALWVKLFLKRRAELDHKRFSQMSANQSNLIQLISSMQEIKINGCELQKRWEWEKIQARLFRVSIKGLALGQYQQSGAILINEVKNILITIIAAKTVIEGGMSLGMMLAVQYIIGQMNSPIDQLIGFFNLTQDAKISLERLSEIHQQKNEEEDSENKMSQLSNRTSIEIKDVSFQYEGPESEKVLDGINFKIESGTQTAIVGTSGSGKTTLMKLMLGFYPISKGEIRLGGTSLNLFNMRCWRENCGVVMQDGFIYSDTIANNIAPGAEIIDKYQLLKAASIANIASFIESLPLGYNTRIGADGHGLSQGQKQRILIARAIYKNPKFIFFDEATNSLDSTNERIIMENLHKYFVGRTVMIIAHRLSTVRSADQIVVLDKGKIVEIGKYNELIQRKGAYYSLVKNQLEL